MSRLPLLSVASVLVLGAVPVLQAQSAVGSWWTGDTNVTTSGSGGVMEIAVPYPDNVHPVPESELRVGIAADMAQAKAHPKDAGPHVRLAYELLDAGAGAHAQAEAREATKLAPKLAEAFRALAWTLEHDSIGVRFERGFDWKGSIAAWKRTAELDPKEQEATAELTMLEERDANGFPSDKRVAVEAQHYGDARDIVQELIQAELMGKLDEVVVTKVLARHAYGTEALWQAAVKRNLVAQGQLLLLWQKTGRSLQELAQNALQSTKLTVSGDNGVFFVTRNGNAAETFLVVKEDGQFRIVGTARNDAEAGAEAIYQMKQGNEAAARAILNWKLSQTRGGRGGARVETSVGAGKDGVLLAAAGLMAGRSDIGPLLSHVAALRDKTLAEHQGSIDMVLARGYIYVGDGARATVVTRRMKAANPGNEVIEGLCMQADSLTRDFADWKAMLAAQLARRPGNRAAMEAEAKEAETEGDFAAARVDLKQIIDAGNGTVTDPNLYGWLALFSTPIAADALPSALKANEMSGYANFSAIHTLACLYAETGDPVGSRKTILHGMEINHLAEPNDAVWMVMGYIYEDYGLRDSAIMAYRNVVKPDKVPDVTESYILAQRRLKALGVL